MTTPRTLQDLVNLLQQIAPGSTVVLSDSDNEGCITIHTNFELARDRQTLNSVPVSDQSVKTFRY